MDQPSDGSARHPARRGAGELESEVLAALWASGERALTAAEVQRAVDADLAYNTVQTILARLFDKGLVGRSPEGRRHRYRPVKGAEETAAEQMRALLRRGPDRLGVLQRFARSLSEEEAEALRAMLRRRG
jgi:predicted transcriptional regulator